MIAEKQAVTTMCDKVIGGILFVGSVVGWVYLQKHNIPLLPPSDSPVASQFSELSFETANLSERNAITQIIKEVVQEAGDEVISSVMAESLLAHPMVSNHASMAGLTGLAAAYKYFLSNTFWYDSHFWDHRVLKRIFVSLQNGLINPGDLGHAHLIKRYHDSITECVKSLGFNFHWENVDALKTYLSNLPGYKRDIYLLGAFNRYFNEVHIPLLKLVCDYAVLLDSHLQNYLVDYMRDVLKLDVKVKVKFK